jgi:hypothetical protein
LKSPKHGTPDRVWWFDRSIIDACKQHAGKSAADRLSWLREHLAVCLDWSNMDRIDILSLKGNEELPAIEGTGSRMRVYSPGALTSGRIAGKDYWAADS